MEPGNRFRGVDSASLCSLPAVTTNRVVVPACQVGNQILGSLKGLQIRAQGPLARAQGPLARAQGPLAGAQGLIWWLGSWATVWLFNLSWRVSSCCRLTPPPPPLSLSHGSVRTGEGEEGGQRWHPPHLQASCPAVGLSCMYSKIGQPVTLLTYAQESRTACHLTHLCTGI
jgi:hypothetical protein